VLTSTRAITLADPSDRTSLNTLTDEVTVAGAKTPGDPVNHVDPLGLGDFDWQSFLAGVGYGVFQGVKGIVDAVFPGITQSFANSIDGFESLAAALGHGFSTDPLEIALDALDLEATVDRGSPEFLGGSVCGAVAGGAVTGGAGAAGALRGAAAGAERGLAAGAEGAANAVGQSVARKGLQVISAKEAEVGIARLIDQEAAALDRASAEQAARSAQEAERVEVIRHGQGGHVERGDGRISDEFDF
jgi:hypothetical protein